MLKWLKGVVTNREVLLALVLLAVFLGVGIRVPRFVSRGSIINLLFDASTVGIVAIGLTIVIIGGGIDISIGSILVASAIMAGLIAQEDVSPWIAVGTGVAGGAALGAVNAMLITKLKIPPIVVTLATLSIFRGVLTELTKSKLIGGLPSSFTAIGKGRVGGGPDPVWIMLGLFVVAALAMRFTGFGRVVYSIGSNEAAARLSGVAVSRYQALTYVISGSLAGLAGVVFVARNGTVLPTSGSGLELLVIAAVVVGGTNIFGGEGSIAGTAVAAVLLQTITSAMVVLGISSAWQGAVIGVTILVGVTIFVFGQRRRERELLA
jgi:ribose/xylose/arabinose/galactoside ABC-type transport system permease subunit